MQIFNNIMDFHYLVQLSPVHPFVTICLVSIYVQHRIVPSDIYARV